MKSYYATTTTKEAAWPLGYKRHGNEIHPLHSSIYVSSLNRADSSLLFGTQFSKSWYEKLAMTVNTLHNWQTILVG